MNTHDKIELPPLPEGKYYDGLAMLCYGKDCVESDRQRRGEPTAAEISDVIRNITGCPDIKNGEDSLVVALGMLFHRCATTQPAELVQLGPTEHQSPEKFKMTLTETVKVPSDDTIYLGCARMGLAGASDEEVLNYVRIAKRQNVDATENPS